MNGTRPQKFPGTDEEREANFRTHHFVSFDPDELTRCSACDCREFGESCYWPCGAEIPREEF